MPPRDNEETQPSQSVSAWYGKVKPRVCTPNPTPQVLQQQVMYKPRTKEAWCVTVALMRIIVLGLKTLVVYAIGFCGTTLATFG